MRTALHRVAAGALAYVVSYVLVGLATAPRLDQYLTHDSGTVTALEVYQSAGSPLWQAVGWFTLNAHGIPVDLAAVRHTGNFVAEGMWLSIIPGWLGLVPMVACLLVGVVVAATSRSSPVPLSVGAYMIPGYLFAVATSTVVFAGALGPVTASAGVSVVMKSYPGGRWLLLVVCSTLVFGSLGAWLGRSPVVTATIERLRTGPSLR